MFCEIYLQSPAHITTIHDLFILLSSFKTDPRFPILDPRSSILEPEFPVITLEVLLIKMVLFFDHWGNQLFQNNQRFPEIEFVDRPVPEKLDMGFLFFGHEVPQVEYVIVQ